MKVKIGIEFDVDTEEEDVAEAAASLAAYHYLSFVRVSGSGRGSDVGEVRVHVDGYGEVTVRFGEDHD